MLVDYMKDKEKTKASHDRWTKCHAVCMWICTPQVNKKAEEGPKLDTLWSVWELWLKILTLTYIHTTMDWESEQGIFVPAKWRNLPLFVQVEMVVRVLLPESNKGVQDVILEDEDVQFNCALISQDLDSYEEAFIRSRSSMGSGGSRNLARGFHRSTILYYNI